MTDSTTIAVRRLELDGSPIDVMLMAVRPEGPDVACDFRIVGLRSGPIDGTGFGVDGIQAILSALTRVGDLLARDAPTATFLGAPDRMLPTTRVTNGLAESVVGAPTAIPPGAPRSASPRRS